MSSNPTVPSEAEFMLQDAARQLADSLQKRDRELAALAGSRWLPTVTDLVVEGVSSLTCTLAIPRDLPIFSGHFPGIPIVPGVVQVGWAVELATTQGLVQGPMTAIVAAKFRRVVQPGLRLSARIECIARSGILNFTYETQQVIVSTGRLRFEVDHG